MLRECIEPSGLTITQAAAALGVTRNTLSELVNGKRGISPEMAAWLTRLFGGNAESWLVQQAQYDLARVRADRIKLKNIWAIPSAYTFAYTIAYPSCYREFAGEWL